MNVKELIEELKKYSPEMEVYRTLHDKELEEITPINSVDTYGLTEPKYKLVLEIGL